MSNAVSSVVAVTGLILLADSLVALGRASQLCGSQREHLTALPNLEYDYTTYEVEGCVLDGVSLTVSSFGSNILSCEISVPHPCIIMLFQ